MLSLIDNILPSLGIEDPEDPKVVIMLTHRRDDQGSRMEVRTIPESTSLHSQITALFNDNLIRDIPEDVTYSLELSSTTGPTVKVNGSDDYNPKDKEVVKWLQRHCYRELFMAYDNLKAMLRSLPEEEVLKTYVQRRLRETFLHAAMQGQTELLEPGTIMPVAACLCGKRSAGQQMADDESLPETACVLHLAGCANIFFDLSCQLYEAATRRLFEEVEYDTLTSLHRTFMEAGEAIEKNLS